MHNDTPLGTSVHLKETRAAGSRNIPLAAT
jgi:hypothetical protein